MKVFQILFHNEIRFFDDRHKDNILYTENNDHDLGQLYTLQQPAPRSIWDYTHISETQFQLRGNAIIFLLQSTRHFKFQVETFWIALDYFERFLFEYQTRKFEWNSENVYLCATVCFFIAAKSEETHVDITLGTLVKMFHKSTYTKSQFLAAELYILDTLEWNLILRFSPETHLHEILKKVNLSHVLDPVKKELFYHFARMLLFVGSLYYGPLIHKRLQHRFVNAALYGAYHIFAIPSEIRHVIDADERTLGIKFLHKTAILPDFVNDMFGLTLRYEDIQTPESKEEDTHTQKNL